MRGYTAKKGNRYYAVIYEGVDPATGKERRRWYPAGTRKADAERLVTELMKRKNDGEYRPPDRITVGSYLTDKWLPAKRAQLRPSTYDSYRRNIDRHVIPALGRIPLQRLTPEDLDALYTALAEGHGEEQRGLAPKTIHSIHEMLHKALADAARKGSIVRNVADLADPPKLSSAKKRAMRVWEADQLREFLDGIEDHRLYPAYYLAANTGMRRGEVLGLRWRDVDFEARRLSVNQAWSRSPTPSRSPASRPARAAERSTLTRERSPSSGRGGSTSSRNVSRSAVSARITGSCSPAPRARRSTRTSSARPLTGWRPAPASRSSASTIFDTATPAFC
jgi:integrase